MYLDKRSNQLLMEIFKSPSTTIDDLQKEFNLTSRQINYSFSKLNNWLKENDYSEIQRNGNHFIISSDLSQALFDENATHVNQYVFKNSERAHLIILILGSHTEELSLNHLISDLEVSKNTALRDLKLAQKSLNEYELLIKYSRKVGYFIDGDELNLRRALMASLEYFIRNINGEHVIRRFLKIDHYKINSWRKRLEQVEKYLEYQFVDQRMQILPYILEIIFRRIEMGRSIQETFFIDFEDLKGTKEYEAAGILIDSHPEVSDLEYIYVALQMLISSVFTDDCLTFAGSVALKQALEQLLTEFEKRACIQLVKKKDLMKKLYIHMKPAYYRIKYKLHLKSDYTLLESTDQQFQNMDEMIKLSLTPLETFMGTKIPEKEISFIKLLIVSHLMRTEEFLQTKLKAVVICLNGTSISKMMEQTLRDLFPELFFYQVMGIREFEKTKLKYDIVFSSVPVETDKHFFFMHPIINEKERSVLRERVMKSLSIVSNNQLGGNKVNDIMMIIAPYIELRNVKKLKKGLEHYFEVDESKSCICTIYDSTCDHKLLCIKRRHNT